jgi:hypothetical protein
LSPDGDRIGRYSIFQYQRVENSGYKYVWVGEFGEYVDLTFNQTNLVTIWQKTFFLTK